MRVNDVNKIAIVGAGFSGTLVAAQLLRLSANPLTVYLIEPDLRQFGRGVAYSADQDCHLLNVPACNMSAFPDDPEHFYNWAKTREKSLLNAPWVTEVNRCSFLPRRAYGDYLLELLHKAERTALAGVRLEKKFDKAIGLRVGSQGVTIKLLSGEVLDVEKVVLAIGNFPPCDPFVKTPDFYQSSRYYTNPWKTGVLPALLETQSCLLIGSGLTMVDWAVSLSQAGYQGVIHGISRRGLWPQPHRLSSADFVIDLKALPPSVRIWLRQLRQLIRTTDCDWRSVIDALRSDSQSLWESLPLVERRRFLRHLRTFWDCHRHRLAPVVGERLDNLLKTQQLLRHTGRILEYRETGQGVEVVLRRRGQDGLDILSVDAVVNCSGSDSNYRKLGCPLVKDLINQELLRPDALALGLDVTRDGAIISGQGLVSERLFTLGPPQKGMFWETTAVPEIRGQAANLAGFLLAH